MASTYGDGNGEARMMDFVPVPLSRGVFKTKMRDVSPDDLSPPSSQPSPNSSDEKSGVDLSSAGADEVTQQNDQPQSVSMENNPLETQTLLRVGSSRGHRN